MKRKIKNFSDFMECIKAGKKVTDNDDKLFYYFENGYICCEKGGFVWYNTSVDTEDLSQMEVEEQAPFTIEVGKFYRTRDGKKAYCFYKEKEAAYPNHCFIDGEKDSDTYTDGGLTFSEKEKPEDIIGYWEE